MNDLAISAYIKDQYHLIRFLPYQWEDYKFIRLKALKSNPEMFGSNYEKEKLYQDNDWKFLLENHSRAMFALYEANNLIGLCGVTIHQEDTTRAILFSSFIQEAHRGRGLSKLFYQARIDWAKEKACKSIIVSHRVGNTLSRAANKSFGFEYWNTENINWGDDVRAEGLLYMLRLN